MALTENETRRQLIDRQLEKAGWRLDDHTQIRHEVPVDNAAREAPSPAYRQWRADLRVGRSQDGRDGARPSRR